MGNYSVRCVGYANISSLADGAIVDQAYDSSTDVTTAILAITNPNATDIHLQFDQLASGVQNVTVMLPGYSAANATDLNPNYLAQLRRYDTLRMLTITDVDRVFLSNWTQRSTPSNSPSYSGFCCPLQRNDSSVPWEGVIQIANAVQPRAIWLNLQASQADGHRLVVSQCCSGF